MYELKELNFKIENQKEDDDILAMNLGPSNRNPKSRERPMPGYDNDMSLDNLRLDDHFNKLNESSFIKDMPP